MEDEAIVALYLAREEAAVRYTAEKYGSRLRALAMRIVQDAPCAEECENDTYLSAWNLIPPHEPRTYLFAFLGRITNYLNGKNMSLRKVSDILYFASAWFTD